MAWLWLVSALLALGLLLEGFSGFFPSGGRVWGAWCALVGRLLAPLRAILPRPFGLDLSNFLVILLVGSIRLLLLATPGLEGQGP